MHCASSPIGRNRKPVGNSVHFGTRWRGGKFCLRDLVTMNGYASSSLVCATGYGCVYAPGRVDSDSGDVHLCWSEDAVQSWSRYIRGQETRMLGRKWYDEWRYVCHDVFLIGRYCRRPMDKERFSSTHAFFRARRAILFFWMICCLLASFSSTGACLADLSSSSSVAS